MTKPSEEVRGPQDLVAYMNQSTSQDWDSIPFPAKQQLGFHDRLADARSGNGINEYTGKSPEELPGALEQSEVTDGTQRLSSVVDYHLESTAPPAEPAGAPGSDGYNRLNRGVAPAKGFEVDAEHEVTQTAGARVVQFEPDQGLSPEEQAKVDGVGPYVPSPVAIQAGSADGNTTEDELPRFGTANGVRHGDAGSFDRKAAAKRQQRSPGGLADVAEAQRKSEAAPAAGGAGAPAQAQAAPAPASPPVAGGSGGVPSGSIDKVLAWVGDDSGRARQALDAEQGRDEPRQSLISRLNEKLNG
jgi:hypothetical protein